MKGVVRVGSGHKSAVVKVMGERQREGRGARGTKVQQARQRLKPGRPLGRPPQPSPQCAQERIAKTLAHRIVSDGKMTQVSG